MHVARRRSGQKSEQRTDTFSGTVFADPVLSADQIAINNVFFAPGARTYWHSHEGGQILTVGEGRGFVTDRAGVTNLVEAADVIYSAPGEEHWHGATPESYLLHTSIAIGKTTWFEAVDARDYEVASRRASGLTAP